MIAHPRGASRRRDTRTRAGALAPSPARVTPGSRQAEAIAVARYIADLSAQLESMATASRLDLIAYFLAMARAESEACARGAGSALTAADS
jgi:hypothetical protein